MIRINLLAVERERTKKRSTSGAVVIPAAQRVTVIASLILLGTVLVVGWWYWSLRQRSIRLDEDIAKAEIEMQQLRSVLAQVRKFETQKAQLQQRVSLIEQLRKGQSHPVRVLDEISKSLPDFLWLTEMTQKAGDFTITGLTTNLTALSDFAANLEATKWFKKPVEILDSQKLTDAKNADLVKFTVKAQFVDPTAPLPAAPAGRGAPPAGRGAPPPATKAGK